MFAVVSSLYVGISFSLLYNAKRDGVEHVRQFYIALTIFLPLIFGTSIALKMKFGGGTWVGHIVLTKMDE